MSADGAHGPLRPEQRDSRIGLGQGNGGSMASLLVGYLLAGPLMYGVLGWLADRWLGTSYLLPVGVIVGMGLALYTIWLRYGRR